MPLSSRKTKCAFQAALQKIPLLFLNKIYLIVSTMQFRLKDAIPTCSLERENNVKFFFFVFAVVKFSFSAKTYNYKLLKLLSSLVET